METLTLPDGKTIRIPSDLSPEDRRRLDQEIRERYGLSDTPSRDSRADAGIGSLRQRSSRRRQDTGEEGTLLGSMWEGVKSIPRGFRQFGLLAQQGIAALRTPDEDTEREKNLRRRLQELYEEVDPIYREANLPQLGMGLGQVGAMIGTSLIPVVGKPAAFAGAALMGAGEQAGKIADYEKRTGEDVSSGKELASLGLGLGIGLSEMFPWGGAAKKIGLLRGTAREAAETAGARIGRRSAASFMERAAEDVGGVVSSAFRQGIAEAGQEATAGFLQSGVAKWLYDDEAMADAGVNALKEAIIGGETGAVASVLLSMAAGGRRGMRRHTERRMIDALDDESAAAIRDMREGKLFDGRAISDLITSEDPSRVALVESVMDGSLGELAAAQSKKIQDEINKDTSLTNEEKGPKVAAEVRQINNFYREIGLLRASIRKYREGSLAISERRREGRLDEESPMGDPIPIEITDLGQGAVRVRGHHGTKTTSKQAPVETGGAHIGSRLAAMDRLFDTNRERALEAGTDPRALYDERRSKIEVIETTLNKPYGSVDNPISENELDEITRYPESLNELKDEGYDGIIYDNVLEDPGELSVMIFDPNAMEVVDEIDATDELEARTKRSWTVERALNAARKVNEMIDDAMYPNSPLAFKRRPDGFLHEDAKAIAAPNVSEGATLRRYNIGDLIDQVWWRLRPTAVQVEASERARLKEAGVDPAEIEERVEAAVETAIRAEDNIVDLEQRLVTEEQRKGLRKLRQMGVGRKDLFLSPSEVRKMVNDIFEGGVYEMGGISWQTAPSGNPAITIDNAAKIEQAVPVTDTELKQGRIIGDKILSSVIGFRSLVDVGNIIEDTKRDDLTDADKRNLRTHIDDIETGKIITELIDNNLDVTEELAQRALDAKEIGRDLNEVVATTLEMDADDVVWDALREGEQHAVMARILRTEREGIIGRSYDTTSSVSASAGVAILRALSTKGRGGVYRKFNIGRRGNRSKQVQKIMEDISWLFFRGRPSAMAAPTVEQIGDYIERAAAYGLVKYTNDSKTQVQFVTPEEAEAYAPHITEKALEISQTEEKLAETGVERSIPQLRRDAKNLQNAKDRIVRFKEEVRAELGRMGKSDVGVRIAVAADSIYATVEEIVNDPDVIVQSKAYDVGPAASVQDHGTMVLFNLSQMEGNYKKGINTPVETLIKDSAFHEGAHLWYINNDLTLEERRSLEKYGKSQKVPKSVNKQAYDAGMTWRQWTESIYGETNPNIVEETSVRILDSLAQGRVPKSKSSGIMGKIKNDLTTRGTAIVNAARSSDIMPVMKIFEKVQSGELKRRAEAKEQEAEGIGAAQILDRATPEEFYNLTEAAKTGNELEVRRAAQDIVRSRVEEPTISLQQSLINDLRARREIEDTPNVVMPVLNRRALEEGEISAAALNAYFEFSDGRLPPYKFLESVRYKNEQPAGPPGSYSEQRAEAAKKALGKNVGWREDVGGSAVEGLDDHNRYIDKDGNERVIESRRDYKDAMAYTSSEMFRLRFLDQRLPQWLSSKAAQLREGALRQLADVSAISAWRFSDSSLTFLDPIMKYGPMTFVRSEGGHAAEGGFKLEKVYAIDPETGAEKTNEFDERIEVKGFKEIARPLLNAGRDVQISAQYYLSSRRIVDINDELMDARENLRIAKINFVKRTGTQEAVDEYTELRDFWQDKYNKVNPENKLFGKGTLDLAKKEISDHRKAVRAGDKSALIIDKFTEEYQDFNYYEIEMLYNGGLIDRARKIRMQKLSYIPFYRDQGWRNSQPMWNKNNLNSKGDMVIDKALEGSFEPLDTDLFGMIIKNVQSITRDTMWNIAAQRTMRDELAGDTAWDITGMTPDEVSALIRDQNLSNAPSDMIVRLKENGAEKRYLVRDPLLVQSMMTIGFSPTQAIEDFFGKIFRTGGTTLGIKNRKIQTGLAKVLVGSSRILRELVTRSPPFVAKNLLRDSFQASVTFGGGPVLVLKAMINAIDYRTLERAERAGLGMPIDFSPDPEHFGKAAKRMLTRDQMDWKNPISLMSIPWVAMGRMARQSEVATRMVVYDKVLKDTVSADMPNGNVAEATFQAMEIMNYGRRGNAKLFSVFAAMSPFINGRIQGFDVVLRTHTGSLDVPGLYNKEFDGSTAGRIRRMGTSARRGALIAFGTLLYWLMVRDDEEYKNAREDLKNDWWLIPGVGPGDTGIKIPIPFEVGTLYKVLPEQMFRMMAEEEHDFRDVREEIFRQIRATLYLDLRPQLVRPMISAIANKDTFRRDSIVPEWMESSVAASEQYNPYTNEVAKMVGGALNKVPLLRGFDFLTSPMKLEYMARQYTGTIGSYVMVTADRLARGGDIMGVSLPIDKKNLVGTPADFSWGSPDTMPILGDLLYDPVKGGGYQEDFYEMLEDIDKVVNTLRSMEAREDRDRTDEDRYEEKHDELFKAADRIKHFEKRMTHWRADRDRLFTRNDLSDDDKRRMLYRMFEARDDILEEMLKIMGDVRADRTMAEKLFGGRP